MGSEIATAGGIPVPAAAAVAPAVITAAAIFLKSIIAAGIFPCSAATVIAAG